MKQVWQFDPTNGYILAPVLLPEDATIDDSYQTMVKPPENESVKFDRATQTWVVFTPPVDPATAQLADLIKSNAQQMVLNAQLIKQISALQTAKTDTTQGA